MMLHRHFSNQVEQPEPIEVPKPKPKKRRRKRKGEECRAAVFIGTRNLYKDMITAVKSLFANSDVDKVFFVIEDDDFPYFLPREVKIINASKQQYIRPESPNYRSHFSYLCVARSAYAKILEDYGKVLSLDDDLVIVDDISDLWDIDMTGNYCAGVVDLGVNKSGYINGGVVLYNLDAIREDGIDNQMIDKLNREYRRYVDQDVLNECCAGKILVLPNRYNESPVTGRTRDPAIVHYVGVDKRGGPNREYRHYWDEYEEMAWEQVQELRQERYGKSLTW